MELSPHVPEQDEVFESADLPEEAATPTTLGLAPLADSSAEIDLQPVAAIEAFETFMGRHYDPAESLSRGDREEQHAVLRQGVFGPSALHASGRIAVLSTQLEAGMKAQRHRNTAGGGDGARSFESPLQRYSRLSEELHALRTELGAVAEAGLGKATAGAGGASGDSRADVWSRLNEGTRALQEQLASLTPLIAAGQLETHAASAAAAAGGAGSSWYAAALAQLSRVQAAAAAEAPVHPAGGPSSGAAAAVAAAASAGGPDAALDSRVAALEALLLGQPDTTSEPESAERRSAAATGVRSSGLVARLDELSAAVALAQDPRALQDLTERATQATTALRALQQQAAKSTAPGDFVITSARVAAAVSVLEQWDAAAAALPVLASRLASLDGLHREAALFTQRLALAEAAIGATDARLTRDEGLLAELRGGLQAAAEAMTHNVRELRGALEAAPKAGGGPRE